MLFHWAPILGLRLITLVQQYIQSIMCYLIIQIQHFQLTVLRRIFTSQQLDYDSNASHTFGISAFENGSFLGTQEYSLDVLPTPNDTLIIDLTDVSIEYQNNEAFINLVGDILNYDQLTQEYGEIEP